MSRRCRRFIAIFPLTFLLFFAPILRGSSLTALQALVGQLGSDDPRARENAAGELMDLKREDLPLLRAAALSQSPLLPGQIASLRQIVAQVFLVGEKFKIDPNDPSGFMGIQLSRSEPAPQNSGVVVLDRIRGFPAYRYLQSGDVIVRLVDRPGIQLRDADDFINAVKLFHPGDVVRLDVLRYGRPLTVSVPLVFRPMEIVNIQLESAVDAWIQAREERAETYWNENFSILDPVGAPSAGQASTSAEP